MFRNSPSGGCNVAMIVVILISLGLAEQASSQNLEMYLMEGEVSGFGYVDEEWGGDARWIYDDAAPSPWSLSEVADYGATSGGSSLSAIGHNIASGNVGYLGGNYFVGHGNAYAHVAGIDALGGTVEGEMGSWNNRDIPLNADMRISFLGHCEAWAANGGYGAAGFTYTFFWGWSVDTNSSSFAEVTVGVVEDVSGGGSVYWSDHAGGWVTDTGSGGGSVWTNLKIFDPVSNPPAGDVDGDGVVDEWDINLVASNIGATDTRFDTDDDTDVDGDDINEIVSTTLSTSYGDLDLDGDVDQNDRDSMQVGSNGGWAEGDFNGDFYVDSADVAIWEANAP